MLDRDLDFCDQKIEEVCDEMRPITEAWKEAKRNMHTAEVAVNAAKHEYNRCKYVVGQLENKLNQYRHRLNQMRDHRKELKLQKDFLGRQHKAVEDARTK